MKSKLPSKPAPRKPEGNKNQGFRLLFENNPLPMWIYDLETLYFLDVNEAAVEQYGYSPDEFLKLRITDIRPPEDAAIVEKHAKAKRPGLQHSGEWRHCKKDGSIILVEITSHKIKYEGHQAALVTARDITGSRRLEDSARAIETSYRSLFNSVAEAIYIQDRKGRFLDVNDGAAKMYGYPREFLIGKTPDVISAPGRNDLKEVRRAIKLAFEGQPQEFEFWGLRSNGEAFPKNVRLYKGTYLGQDVVIALAQDITERKLAEEALRKLSSAVEQTADNVIITNREGIVQYVNPAFERSTGYTKKEVVGQTPGLLNSGEHKPQFFETLWKKILAGEVFRAVFINRKKNGELFYEEKTITPLRDEQGNITHFVSTGRDITDRKRAEESLAASEAEMRAIFASMPDAIFVFDREGRYLKIAPTNTDILYRPVEELLGKRLHDVFSRQKADELVGYIHDALDKKQTIQFEYALLIGDHITWFSGTTSPLTEDSVVWVGRDITARKLAEDTLQERVAELSVIYDASQRLQRILTPEILADEVIRLLKKTLNYEHGAVLLVDEPSGKLIPFAVSDEGRWFPSLHEYREYVALHELRLGNGVTGWVAQNGRSVCLGDVHNDPRYISTAEDARSELCVPLMVGNSVIGVVNVESAKLNAYTESDQRLLETIAAQMAVAIQNARLYEDSVRRMAELEALHESGLALGKSLDPREISEKVVSVLADRLNWHHAAVRVRRGQSGEVELLAFSQADKYGHIEKVNTGRLMAGRTTLPAGQGMAGWVIEHGRIINSNNLQADPRYYATFANMNSGLYVPIWAGGRTLGCISVETERPNAFSEADERLLTTLASQAASALENARLYQDALRSAERRQVLHAASQEISQISQDSEQVYTAIHRAATQLMQADAFVISLLDEANRQIEGVYLVDRNGRNPNLQIPLGQGLSSRVITSGESIMVNDDLENNVAGVHFGSPDAVRSILAVPLRVSGKVIGAISAQSYEPGVYQTEDQLLLELLAAQAAIAIQNARLYQEALLAAQRRVVLHQVSREVARLNQDSEQLYTAIYQAAARLIPTDMFTIALVNQTEDQIDGVYAIDRGKRGPFISFPLGKGIAGQVIETNRMLLIEDYDDPGVTIERVPFADNPPTRSILAVPLRSGEKAIGSMSIQSYQPGLYTQEDGVLLEMLGAQVTVAIGNARLFEQARRRIKEQEALNRASQSLTSSLELEPLLENILGSARDAIAGAEKGTILLWDKDSEHLRVRTQIGYTDARILELPFRAEKGFVGTAFREKRPILIENALAEYEPPFDESVEEVYQVQSGIVAPLLVKDMAIGAIALDNATKKEAFTKDDLNLLMIFASSAASVIENARLFEETRRRADEFEALYQTAADVSSETDLKVLLNTIVKRAQTLSGASGSGLYLFDPEHSDLELVAINDPDITSGTRLALGEGLSGRVAQTKQPLIVNDYQTWQNRSSHFNRISITSVLGIPMLYNGELIGVLNVHNRADPNQTGPGRVFNEQDINLLSLFANTAAGAVYSARLLEKTRRRLDELAALAQVSSALRTASTRPEIMSALLDELMNVLHADGGNLVSSVPGRDDLLIEAACGVDTNYAGIWIPPGKGLSRRVIDSGEPLLMADARKDPSFFNPDGDEKAYSIILVPLKSQDKTIGVISMGRIEKDSLLPAPFSEDDMRLLTAIADMSANALQRHALHEQTMRHAEQLIIINDLGHELSETLDLSHIYEKLCRAVLDLLADTATILVSLFDTNERSIRAVSGMHAGAIINAADLPAMQFDETGYQNQSRVIHSGLPLIVPDLIESIKNEKAIPVKSENDGQAAQSGLYIPMEVEGRVIGVLEARSNDKNRYTSADAELLRLVANTAASAIQNARLFAQLKQRVDQLSALHSVDIAISSTTDLRVSLQSVLENIIRQLKVDASDVLLLNPSTLVLQYIAGLGFFTSEITRTALPLGQGQAGRSALERQIVHIPDLNDPGAKFANKNLTMEERFVSYVAVPLMAKGEVKGVLEIFHRSRLGFDDEWISFLEMLAGQAALAIDNALLFEGLEKVNIELSMAYDATIAGWSQALELRDQETQGHSLRVLDLALRLAAEMGIPSKDLQDMRRGILLHDIGKMGVPDSILRKPGKLTDNEWEIMRKHPGFAYDMLAPIAYLRNSLDIPYCHHEKWDGSGYPRGLSGETIPLPARIFAIVDVFDALTSNRPYREAWSKEKTLDYIREQSGLHFDPRLVEIFLKFIRE